MRYSFCTKGNKQRQIMPVLLAVVTVLAMCMLLVSLPNKTHSEPRSSPTRQLSSLAAGARDVDLRIDLQVDSSEALPGDILTYTLTFQNRGTRTARNVELTVNAPNPGAPDPDNEGLFTTLFKNNQTSLGPGLVTTNSAGLLMSIAWSVDSLPPAMASAQLVEFQLQITPALDESKALTTTATISATDFSPSEVSATTQVSLSSDIRIRKVVVTPPVYDVTDTVEYHIYVENLGNKSEPLVVVRDSIPAGAVFVGSQPQHLDSPDDRGPVFSWNLNNIERNGGRDTVVVWLTFAISGVHVNAAGGQIDEVPIPGNRVAIEVFGLGDPPDGPRFKISKRILSGTPIVADDLVEYEISVTNLDNQAHTLSVFDDVPAEAELIAFDPDTSAGASAWRPRLGWLARDIPANGSAAFTARVTLRFSKPGEFTNVTRAQLDTIPVALASVTANVLPRSNIVARFTTCLGNAEPGANINLTADISNLGGSDAAPVDVAFFVDSISPANKIDEDQIAILAMGTTQSLSTSFMNTQGGSRLYYIFADPDNLIDETAAFEADNIDSTLCPPPEPPRITVTPPTLCAGDQASVLLETFASLQSGHVLVIFANGQQDTLQTVLPAPGSPVTTGFRDTNPRLNLPDEVILFEFHTLDVFDNANVDSDTLAIKCADAFKLGENIYRPTVLPEGLPIQFRLSTRRNARLKIYDLAGREIDTVYDSEAQAGWNSLTWKGRDKSNRQVGAGVYVVTIESGELRGWRKFILVR